MIAIVVHEMVFVTAELISYFLYYPSDVFVWKFCVADVNALSKAELFAKLVIFTRCNFKDATEWKWMTT